MFVWSYPIADLPVNGVGVALKAPSLEYGINKNPSNDAANRIFGTPITIFASVTSVAPINILRASSTALTFRLIVPVVDSLILVSPAIPSIKYSRVPPTDTSPLIAIPLFENVAFTPVPA